MKKILAFIAFLALFGISTTTLAQEKKTPRELAKEKTMELKEQVGLEEEQIDGVFNFYLKQVKEEQGIQEMIANNNPKVKKIEESKEERAAKREAALKELLTEEQFKKYKETQQ
ncbi:hypothetical protein ACFQ1M_15490 [Sungkyunkwania multivorans]|uniref:Uncharacterized protein n=1 Tax=Sungkyunkwania multivorans TaxID=1173618 RepID=A0ABW3D208_9FLAO